MFRYFLYPYVLIYDKYIHCIFCQFITKTIVSRYVNSDQQKSPLWFCQRGLDLCFGSYLLLEWQIVVVNVYATGVVIVCCQPARLIGWRRHLITAGVGRS